jgi:hypothetical protein
MGLLQVYPPRLLAQLQDLLVLLSLLRGLLLMQGTLALQQAAHPNKPRSKAKNPRPMELLGTLPRAPPCPTHECDLDS